MNDPDNNGIVKTKIGVSALSKNQNSYTEILSNMAKTIRDAVNGVQINFELIKSRVSSPKIPEIKFMPQVPTVMTDNGILSTTTLIERNNKKMENKKNDTENDVEVSPVEKYLTFCGIILDISKKSNLAISGALVIKTIDTLTSHPDVVQHITGSTELSSITVEHLIEYTTGAIKCMASESMERMARYTSPNPITLNDTKTEIDMRICNALTIAYDIMSACIQYKGICTSPTISNLNSIVKLESIPSMAKIRVLCHCANQGSVTVPLVEQTVKEYYYKISNAVAEISHDSINRLDPNTNHDAYYDYDKYLDKILENVDTYRKVITLLTSYLNAGVD